MATQDLPGGIAKATQLIALDNGGINHSRSEQDQRCDLAVFIARKRSSYDLDAIDAWLLGLSDDELDVVCCGESDDSAAAVKHAPLGTNELLNDYFDEFC